MAISTGFRPRSKDERLAMARLLFDAPLRVALEYEDDGWASTCLRVAGRTPVWAGQGDRHRIESVLTRLGLPGLADGEADGRLLPDLTLERTGPVQASPLPEISGPLVSILICTYNRKSMVMDSIASAQAQSWPREILVIDDASTDGTDELLSQVEGIRYLRQEKNEGKSVALNRGLAEARGEAVMVLDDDDLLLPGALRVLAGVLFSNPDLAAVYSDTICFDGTTGKARKVFPCTRAPGHMARHVALKQIPCTTGATLIRMSAQRQAGEYDVSLIRAEDMDMFLRLAHVGPIEGIPIPTFLARTHDGLRGTADVRWKKKDKATEEERSRAFIKPTFQRRWKELGANADRTLAHAWAIGLGIRGLLPLAHTELARWPGPYTPYETWVRTQCRLPAPPKDLAGTLVVIDDGDPGSVELLLDREPSDLDLWVCLEVPRDPLASLMLYWPGHYESHKRLADWVQPKGPVHLRTSSDPHWQPPPLADLSLLPDLPAPDALLALAAVKNWGLPLGTRSAGPRQSGPLALAALKSRYCLGRGNAEDALGYAGDVIAEAATWCGGWMLAAEAFLAMSQTDQALFCGRQAERLQATVLETLRKRQAA